MPPQQPLSSTTVQNELHSDQTTDDADCNGGSQIETSKEMGEEGMEEEDSLNDEKNEIETREEGDIAEGNDDADGRDTPEEIQLAEDMMINGTGHGNTGARLEFSANTPATSATAGQQEQQHTGKEALDQHLRTCVSRIFFLAKVWSAVVLLIITLLLFNKIRLEHQKNSSAVDFEPPQLSSTTAPITTLDYDPLSTTTKTITTTTTITTTSVQIQEPRHPLAYPPMRSTTMQSTSFSTTFLPPTTSQQENNAEHLRTCKNFICENLNASETLAWNNKCFPRVVREGELIFTLNLLLLITFGGLGNLLTLMSICYVAYWPKYRAKFPFLWNSVTILLMHLSLCDLLYCFLGLPFFLMTYLNKGLVFSDSFCWLSALFRQFFAYADFLTLSLIAVTRMLGIRRNLRSPGGLQKGGFFEEPVFAVICCLGTWCVAGFIISPIIFEIKSETLGIDFGKFGYVGRYGMCNTVDCPTKKMSGGAVVYTVAFFIPFLSLNISYLLLAVAIKNFLPLIKTENALGSGDAGQCQMRRQRQLEEQQLNKEFGQQQTFDMQQLNRTLLCLCLTYVIFCGTLLPIEWSDNFIGMTDEQQATLMVIVYNWYWWVYAVNNIVYFFSLRAFREIYRIFLTDMYKSAVYAAMQGLAKISPSRRGEIRVTKPKQEAAGGFCFGITNRGGCKEENMEGSWRQADERGGRAPIPTISSVQLEMTTNVSIVCRIDV